jgi:hypothetical protein
VTLSADLPAIWPQQPKEKANMGITPTQADIGREASSGFQSGPRTASHPSERYDRRSGAINEGGFQNTIRLDVRDEEPLPVVCPEQKDEATND